MRLSDFSGIVFALVSLVVVVCSHQETNAQRMARGLPPRAPKWALEREYAVHNHGTPVYAGKRTQTSSTPPVIYTGRLELRNPDGSALGHIRNWATPGTISGVNFLGADEDLLVKFVVSGNDPLDIIATNPAFPAPFYVGAGGNSLHNDPVLATGSRNTIDFVNVEQTPANSIPIKSASEGLNMESAIWFFDPTTREVKAQWVNPDGSKPSTTLVYDIRENSIFFVGDISAYNKDNDTPASIAQLYLV